MAVLWISAVSGTRSAYAGVCIVNQLKVYPTVGQSQVDYLPARVAQGDIGAKAGRIYGPAIRLATGKCRKKANRQGGKETHDQANPTTLLIAFSLGFEAIGQEGRSADVGVMLLRRISASYLRGGIARHRTKLRVGQSAFVSMGK